MSTLATTRSVAFLLALVTAALLFTAGCHRKAGVSASVAVAREPAGDFAGNAACAECHAGEFRTHHGSRHDTTLRLADRQALGQQAPPLGVVPLAGYALVEQNRQLLLSRSIPEERSQLLNFVLGSGKIGMTFVSLLDASALMETRMSYFPGLHLWEVTPGQEVALPEDDVFGRRHDAADSRRCLGCHSTTLPADTLKADPGFLGVGCESCHGPGRKHIEGIRAGNTTDARMEQIGSWKGSRINDLCGRCHRNPKDVDPSSIGANETHRFQPYALYRSACRSADGEPLSCLRCHDPHTDVSADTQRYEADCLKCHTANLTPTQARLANARQGRVCPVNARSGCIGCHMRPLKAFANTNISATMVDHLISISKREKP